ncbi:hypothetical protein ACFWPU_07455 [Streptomyces sp. NPDC058471]|uniref:hypothetical protein n=1 Tax=Streptomyces sp. NPDC058471 TaxID=3346516 RepID=UPI003647567C
MRPVPRHRGDRGGGRRDSTAARAEGAERDLTYDESDELVDYVGDLYDSNAAARHPLCSHVDIRHGLYHLDLGKARQAEIVLARRASLPK